MTLTHFTEQAMEIAYAERLMDKRREQEAGYAEAFAEAYARDAMADGADNEYNGRT